jgi:hypothetical protein
MRNRRFARVLLLLAIAVAPGCQAFYAYRPIAVQIQDAETKQPIPGAVVHISYPLIHASQAPYDSVGATQADGVARLRAAPTGPAGVLVEVNGKGYLIDEKTLPIATIQALKPAGWFEKVDQRPVDVAIQLYAEPRPAVELVLPPSFRGTIKAEVQVQPDAPNPPGLRLFRYAVSPLGGVKVVGSALVGRVLPLDYQAVTAEGVRLSREAKGLDMGFYAVKSDERELTFFVGTRAEYDAIRNAELGEGRSGQGKSGSGKGGGGGRGGKRGQPPTDPSASTGGS